MLSRTRKKNREKDDYESGRAKDFYLELGSSKRATSSSEVTATAPAVDNAAAAAAKESESITERPEIDEQR